MNESAERARSVCFTGHRPEKLTRDEASIKKDLEQQILQAIAEGICFFITGMAKGVDIWAAQIVLKLRDDGYDVKLICACPYEGFGKGWSKKWQNQYKDILAAADSVIYICKCYNRSCYQTRNEWMVNNSSKVIAVFNGEKGGTKNTIDYAAKVCVPVVYING